METIHEQKPQHNLHRNWVKISHWVVTLSFLILAFSGIEILMVHPRLYWGEVGNDLTPALFELPISRNHQHGGWEENGAFFDRADSPISANRTFDIFNHNGWGRSLHFLFAWVLVITGVIYLLAGVRTGHFKKHIWPHLKEFSPQLVWQDMMRHIKMKIPPTTGGPQYGLLQKFAYATVIFIMLPMTVVTGLTMSPTVTAAYPFLLDVFGGMQSARTIHFFASVALVLFLLVHVLMIIKSGFNQQIRHMTLGK